MDGPSERKPEPPSPLRRQDLAARLAGVASHGPTKAARFLPARGFSGTGMPNRLLGRRRGRLGLALGQSRDVVSDESVDAGIADPSPNRSH